MPIWISTCQGAYIFSVWWVVCFFVLLLLSLSQSPLQHVGCHSIFSYICNNAKSSRRHVFHCVLKFLSGSQGRANKMKKRYFLFQTDIVLKQLHLATSSKIGHSISDLLINGIFHTVIRWIKEGFSKLFIFWKNLSSVSDVFQHLIFLFSVPAAGGLGVQCTWEQPMAQHIWNITNRSCRFASRWKYTVAFMSCSSMNLLF